MFRNNIFTVLLFSSLCASVTTAGAEVIFKEDFSGFYSEGIDLIINSTDNAPLNNRELRWWQDKNTRVVEISTIATYDTTGGLQSVPVPINPAISASDIPAGRGGNITHGAFLFPYSAGYDLWVEERFTIEPWALDGRPGLKDVWIQFDQFIPTNYKDRELSGHWGSKQFVLYAETYSSGHPTFIAGRVTGSHKALDGFLQATYKFTDSSRPLGYFQVGEDNKYDGPALVDRTKDLGKWQRHTIHFKVPTTKALSDGAIEYWIRHGDGVVVKHMEVLNHDGVIDGYEDWIRKGYLLGWSNNGFDEPTSFLITNFILAESVQHIDNSAIVYVAAPKSPNMFVVKK